MERSMLGIACIGATIILIVVLWCYWTYLDVHKIKFDVKSVFTYTYFISSLFFLVSIGFVFLSDNISFKFMLGASIFYLLSYINDKNTDKSIDNKVNVIVFSFKLVIIMFLVLGIPCFPFFHKKEIIELVGIFKDLVTLSTVFDALSFWLKHGFDNIKDSKLNHSFFHKAILFSLGIKCKQQQDLIS